jgi:ABC-2 type transport system ATP-binding protein
VNTPLVELRGLRKRYGERTVLALDLTIETRAIVGVVGPDGAGKTTLLRALAGLLEVEGTVARVLGHDLRADVTALKARVGYVPQTFSLHPDLSIAENLRFAARVHRLADDVAAERSARLLERTGLAPFAGRRAGALSGGMRQKLAVAAALLAAPELLVLDEPTAGVDVLARDELWELLVEARADALVVLSTSYLEEAAACDLLVYLDDGRLRAVDTPDALREASPLVPYRVWGDDGRLLARAARTLPYVRTARGGTRAARVEVARAAAPEAAEVLRDLRGLTAGTPRFAEALAADMESTLLALAQGWTA